MAKRYKGQTLSIHGVPRQGNLIVGVTFEDCTIIGPAVVVPTATSFSGCGFNVAGNVESILWVVTPERDPVVGAIGLSGCSFVRCKFEKIGIAGRPDDIAMWRRSLSGLGEVSIGEPPGGPRLPM